MLIIFCGEDVVLSRQKFLLYQQDKKEKGFDLLLIKAENIISELSEISASLGLFFEKKMIILENCLKDKKCRDLLKDFQLSDIEIVIFETTLSEKELKFVYPKAKFYNSRLSSTVFTLLDSISPNNLKSTIRYLDDVINKDNELLIFYMIKARIKDLILLKKGILENSRLAPWQIGKLNQQAKLWEEERLLTCYDNLFKIEKNVKTNGGVFSVKQSLEMLFCFYL